MVGFCLHSLMFLLYVFFPSKLCFPDVSPFTRTVLQGLNDRLRHMPHRYTVSQILNCWEMALRHACKPNHNPSKEVSALTVALGV